MGTNQHHEGHLNAFEDDANEIKIFPKGLNVVWGRNPRYWRLPDNERDPLELKQVCWLEVTCSVDINKTKITKGCSYEVGFKYSLASDAFGWRNSGSPLYIMRKIGGKNGAPKWKKITSLESNGELKSDKITISTQEMKNGPIILYFGLYEVWSGKWKGGLKIHHAFVRKVQ